MKPTWAVALLGLALPAWGAPITFNTALPVTRGEGIVRTQYIRRERAAADRSVEISALALAAGYGIRGDLALFAAVPILDKRLTAGDVRRDTRGLGDATVFGRYTLFQRDGPGRTLRIAPILGLIAPSGRDDDRDSRGRLPRPLQTGTGAWGGLAGVVVTRQTLRWQVDGQLAVQDFGRDEGFAPGRRFAAEVSGQLRIWPGRLGGGVPGFVYAVLEAGWSDAEADRLGGVKTASGGTQLLLAPGLQYVSRRWVLEAAVQLPIAQNAPAGALEDDFVARLSTRWNF